MSTSNERAASFNRKSWWKDVPYPGKFAIAIVVIFVCFGLVFAFVHSLSDSDYHQSVQENTYQGKVIGVTLLEWDTENQRKIIHFCSVDKLKSLSVGLNIMETVLATVAGQDTTHISVVVTCNDFMQEVEGNRTLYSKKDPPDRLQILSRLAFCDDKSITIPSSKPLGKNPEVRSEFIYFQGDSVPDFSD